MLSLIHLLDCEGDLLIWILLVLIVLTLLKLQIDALHDAVKVEMVVEV
jgi:hypothetical protein